MIVELTQPQGEGKRKKLNATSAFEDEEHMLSILVSLFTNLESDTPARIRLIAKFIEGEYEKVDRLLEMREVAINRLKPAEKEIQMERKVMQANEEEIDEETEAEWYLRRAEAGLAALQNADYVLGWVCMEDDGAMAHAKVMLGRKDLSLLDVVKVLEGGSSSFIFYPLSSPTSSCKHGMAQTDRRNR